MAASSSTAGCATGLIVYDASEAKTNGTRLARLLIDVGTHVLRKFLHSIYPPETLENVLKENRARLQILKTKKVILIVSGNIYFLRRVSRQTLQHLKSRFYIC